MQMTNSSINNESRVLLHVGKIRTPEVFSSDVSLAHSSDVDPGGPRPDSFNSLVIATGGIIHK